MASHAGILPARTLLGAGMLLVVMQSAWWVPVAAGSLAQHGVVPRVSGASKAAEAEEPPAARVRTSGARCHPDRAALFRLRLDTHWTRELFPKQYPEYRPPAQWSRLIGRSHDARFSLFHVGVPAGDALAAFAETGRADALATVGPPGAVLDEFAAAAVAAGAGRSDASFFADANHTKVSTVVRLVPSPDWFIGLDSVDLCPDGFWLESYTLQVWPLDAGSDSGFTFTAPNWPSEPRQPVTRISAHAPNHRAASFFYPELRRLPPIATFRIKLERKFRVIEEAEAGAGELSNDVVPADAPHTPHVHQGHHAPHKRPAHSTNSPRRANKQRRKKAQRAAAAAAAVAARSAADTACVAGAWGPWAPCSAGCGVGEAVRERRVLRAAKPGGAACPPLRESRPCSADRACRTSFFRW